MTFDFSNKTVLITGGNAGIGKTCAEMFAASNAKVMIAARREQESLAVVDEINKQGGQASFVKVDMVDVKSIKNMVDETVQQLGHIDFAINNAGVLGSTSIPLDEYPDDEYDYVMDVNVKGVYYAMKHELVHMLTRKQGVIVNMSSIAGIKAGKTSSIYTASKHAVIGLTRAAAHEYARKGIRINAICPALIETPMAAGLTESDKKIFADHIPMGRLGRPEEVAGAALWLCSDLSTFATGIAIPIDGGVTA